MESVQAKVRVTNLNVKQQAYIVDGNSVEGEAVELRASGHWVNTSEGGTEEVYPVSLHLTVYPGHGVISALGDCLEVIVMRK